MTKSSLKQALKQRIEFSKHSASSNHAIDKTEKPAKANPHSKECKNLKERTQGDKLAFVQSGKVNKRPSNKFDKNQRSNLVRQDNKASNKSKLAQIKPTLQKIENKDSKPKIPQSQPNVREKAIKDTDSVDKDKLSWSDISDTIDSDATNDSDSDVMELETPTESTTAQLTALQSSMQKKLEGAQFRWLNQELYSMCGTDALDLLKKQPHLFDMYHRGFRAQAQSWPETPVQRIIREMKEHSQPPCVIVDLGCGDADIAVALTPLKYTVHSFDLVASPPHVQAANMSNVPLADGIADIVVFSLALMNTDWGKCAAEGVRLLRKGGIMKIAEVVSRIGDLDTFVASLQEIFGLACVNKDSTSNPMFVYLTLRKKSAKVSKSQVAQLEPLKPCIYKRR